MLVSPPASLHSEANASILPFVCKVMGYQGSNLFQQACRVGGDLVPVRVPFVNPARRPMSSVHEPNHISLPCAFPVLHPHSRVLAVAVSLCLSVVILLSSYRPFSLSRLLESCFTVCTRPESLARSHSFRTINRCHSAKSSVR